MRRRNRKHREPSDAERIATAERDAETFALQGDFAAARKAMRRLKDIELAALMTRRIDSNLPKHPMRLRQEALARNAHNAKYAWRRRWMVPVPPHPTRREVRAFMRRNAPRGDTSSEGGRDANGPLRK